MSIVGNVSDWLEDRNRLLLLTHERPDGDALGSLTGLHLALQSRGKHCTSYLRSDIPRRYRELLPEPDGLFVGTLPPELDFDGVVCLDGTSWQRMDVPPGLEPRTADLPSCVIDHHPDNQRFAQLSWVAPDSAATAQMLIRLLRRWPRATGPDVAECLLCGLIMDTGAFRFANTDARVLRDAAYLIGAGANYRRLMEALFLREPFGRRLLEAKIVGEATFAHDRRLIYSVLTDSMMRETDVQPEDTEGLIDALKIVEGVDIACLIQPGVDHIRLSLRSKNSAYPVDSIAHAFGGGGHQLAAGARVADATFEDVEQQLLGLTRRILNHDRSEAVG